MSSKPESDDAAGAAWTLPDELRMLADLGDADTVREVLTVFQSDTETRLRNLRAAVDSQDAVRARAEAHAIKGSSGQVGAIRVSTLCKEIEAAALRQDLDEARRLLHDVESAFQAVRTAMSQAKF